MQARCIELELNENGSLQIVPITFRGLSAIMLQVHIYKEGSYNIIALSPRCIKFAISLEPGETPTDSTYHLAPDDCGL